MATEISPYSDNSNPTNHPNSATTTTTQAPTPITSVYSSLHSYPFDTDTAFLSGLSQIFGHPGTPVTEAERSQKPDLVVSAKCFYFSRKFQTPTPINPSAYKAWLAESSQDVPQSSTTLASASAVVATSTEQPTPDNTVSVPTDTPVSDAAQVPAQPQSQPPLTSQTQPSQSQPQPPPYPTSFAAIVDLITNNKPIPGIEEIPTTVLELGSSKQDKVTRRRKPWEKDSDTDTDKTLLNDTGNNIDGQQDTTTSTATDVAMDAGVAKPDDDQGSESVNSTRQQIRGEGVMRLLRPDAVPDGGLIAKD